MAGADGLVDAAEVTGNPCVLSFALIADGLAFRDADPMHALGALHRGLVVAQDSGNRFTESHLALIPARHEADHGHKRSSQPMSDPARLIHHLGESQRS